MIGVQIQDGSRERYDPITLPHVAYLVKSAVSKTLAKLEAASRILFYFFIDIFLVTTI